MSIFPGRRAWILVVHILFRNFWKSHRKAAFLTRINESSAVKLKTRSCAYLVLPAWEQVWVCVVLEQQLGQSVKRLDADRSSVPDWFSIWPITDRRWAYPVTDSIDTDILVWVFVSKKWLHNKREVEGTKIFLLTVTLCSFVDGKLSMVPANETALWLTSRKHDCDCSDLEINVWNLQ